MRIYLQQEGYSLVSTLPPSRGLGKLVVDDPEADEDDGRVLVLVVPKRTVLEPKLWEGELERNGCQQLMLCAMGEVGEDAQVGDARLIGPGELAAWLRDHGLGVNRVTFEVSVLDPTLIESVGGLDT